MKRLRKAALVGAAAVLVGAGLGLAAKASGVQFSRVASNSMSPAIHPGDWIVTRGLFGGDRNAIQREDIVLFRFPLSTPGRAVKRVVAIEGDRVAIRARTVTVGDRVIEIDGAPSPGAAQPRVESVPQGHVFLLGDNAAVSIDSRSMGTVPETELVGQVLFIIPERAPVAVAIAAIILLLGAALIARRRRRSRPA